MLMYACVSISADKGTIDDRKLCFLTRELIPVNMRHVSWLFGKDSTTLDEKQRLMFSEIRDPRMGTLVAEFRPSCRLGKRERNDYAGCSLESIERSSITRRRNNAAKRLPQMAG